MRSRRLVQPVKPRSRKTSRELARDVARVVFSPIAVPCCYIWNYRANKRHDLRLVDQCRDTPPPRGMDKGKRRRAIASRLPRRKRKALAVSAPQPDCSLLDFPLELRELIWKECLGGGTLHILYRTHRWCKSREPDMCDVPLHENDGVNPMSLFLACRQIYSEASDVFYASNNFKIAHRDHIEYLPRFLPKSRIDTIRSLRFVWPIWGGPPLQTPHYLPEKGLDHKYKVWVTTWANIASMEGLRVLRMRLRVYPPSWKKISKIDADVMLEPVRRVTIPKTFDLIVPFNVMGSDERFEPWRSLPCEIHKCASAWQTRNCDQTFLRQNFEESGNGIFGD